MFNKFCKGFYKFFSSNQDTIRLLFIIVVVAAVIAQILNVSFLKILMIEVGFVIGSFLVLNIGIFIIDFFQDIYDKGKELTEEEKKEVNVK